jgi:SAM-dependent methyltransferase
MKQDWRKEKSRDEHDSSQYSVYDMDYWKKHNEEHVAAFDNPEIKLQTLLDKHPDIRETAIDIGCGAGWASNVLSSYFDKVYALDPSSKAIEVCKDLYKDNQKISWHVGFAEELLPQIETPSSNVLLNTCSVFIHLSDEALHPILNYINNNFTNSILSFQEIYSDDLHFNEGHIACRTQEWWKDNLSNWELDFHGPDMSQWGGQFLNTRKGIHGYKK